MASRPSRRWWHFTGLGALVVVNIVLVGLLWARPGAPAADAQGGSTSPAGTSGSRMAEETASTPMKREPQALVGRDHLGTSGRASRLLVNVDATTAWRASAGSCTTPSTLEHTADGGQTWQDLPLDLAPVSRLRVLGPQSLFAVGGGTNCEPTYVSSSTAGSSWSTHDEYLNGSWYLMPDDRSVMATPVGEIDAPCEAVELAALDAVNAAVLCADSTVRLTQDGGASWAEAGLEMEVRAVGVGQGAYALAGADDSCGDRLAVAAMDIDGGSRPVCTDEAVDASQIAISAGGGVLWLWLDDDVVVATDW